MSGNWVMTEIDGEIIGFIQRDTVNGIAVPFGVFEPDPFERLYTSGWESMGPENDIYLLHMQNVKEGDVFSEKDLKDVAKYYTNSKSVAYAGKAMLDYLGSKESGWEQTEFSRREYDKIAGRWSGSSGVENFLGEIQAHTDMLQNKGIIKILKNLMEYRGKTEEAYFNSLAIADLASSEEGEDKKIMDALWGNNFPNWWLAIFGF